LRKINQTEIIEDDAAESSKIDESIKQLEARLAAAKKRKAESRSRRMVLSKKLYSNRLLRDALLERINSLRHEIVCVREHLDSMYEESLRLSSRLQKLMQINVINDAFHIWYSGPFGTINNFRLGNLPIKPIEWTEINAALGQAVLAISIVSAKAGYEFKKYKLSPMGSFPKIFKSDDLRNGLSLFTDGSFSLFPKRNFNAALTGFLCCVHELGEYTKSRDPTLALPYAINVTDGKVHDQVVLLGSDDDTWTRALKFLLADIKWITAWCTKHCSNHQASRPANVK
jgi:beclin 1